MNEIRGDSSYTTRRKIGERGYNARDGRFCNEQTGGGIASTVTVERSAETEALCHVLQKPRCPARTSLLYGEQDTHEQNCLTTKSWISRTCEQLFTDIDIHSKVDLELRKRTLPEPSPPAHHTHTPHQ